MKIGFIGAGPVATNLGASLRRAGHDISLGHRTGSGFVDAIEDADVVVLAIPYRVCVEVLPALASSLAGRIVVDATNPLSPEYAPIVLDGARSGAEHIADLLPDARIVKAFNTIFADAMTVTAVDASVSRDGRLAGFIAGDDAAATHLVARLAEDAGFAPLVVQSLAAARYLEALAHLNIALAFGTGIGTRGGFAYHRAA